MNLRDGPFGADCRVESCTRGTLEAGQLADIIIVDGDPLIDPGALLEVEVVIKGGRILVDKRKL